MLNSISDNFHQAMKSTQGKVEFSQQFDAIVRGVEESLRKQLSALASKDQLVEESKSTYRKVECYSSSMHDLPSCSPLIYLYNIISWWTSSASTLRQ